MTQISTALLIVISIFAFFGTVSFACTIAFIVLAIGADKRTTESQWSRKIRDTDYMPFDGQAIQDAMDKGEQTGVY